ncbi:serine/threonine protein kinase [Planctomyces sp. SH-PL14]|uniref:serine/threonine protein kinase n=1 Tax=Planctomyces sp. SH-PL14 TaxID=1632864 RepID=UPI00078C94FC|nr:serine/threonine-protein kinase [Planctomyces sp. SH-PL14]AMV21006.1 Serine/threonine-protein kinase PrkC [Planctomyces sp. SH-PL14]
MLQFLKNLFQSKPKVQKLDIRRRFELIGRIGQGSMSKVWRAKDSLTGKVVALKVLDGPKTARLEQKFAQMGVQRPTEGEISLTLRHPNIVHTYEHGVTTENEQFLVMEFIDGVSLSYLVDVQNARMKDHCLSYCIQLGTALEYLHKQLWIHRDLCPRNVVVTPDDVVKLIDFGLMVPNTEEFRRPGNRTGTAMYMAPELIKRQTTDERIDVFSYAVTCFEMFTKQLPWRAGDTLESVLQHINSPPKDLKKLRPDLTDGVVHAIMKGLERDPRDRWPSMKAMVDELRKEAEG